MNEKLRAAAESALQYNFANEALLREALTHSSIADNRLMSNERQEFLGDAVLDLIIVHDIYVRFPTYPEGELTKIKSAVVSRQTCAECAREIGLDKLLIIGKGISSRAAMPSSLVAAVYESVVGAIYLDGGYEAAKAFVLRTMTPKVIEISASIHQQNFKATLQQHTQLKLNASPIYELLDEKGPDHSKAFEVCVNVAGRRFESAWGTNKKIAEQKAALTALRELGVLKPEEADALIEDVNAQGVAEYGE